MPDRHKIIFDGLRVAALAGLLGADIVTSCGKSKAKAGEAEEAATPVTVEAAVLGAIDHIVTADAVLYPVNQANVMPKLGAPVKRVLVNRGDHVKAGQLLAELEAGDLSAAANESKSQCATPKPPIKP